MPHVIIEDNVLLPHPIAKLTWISRSLVTMKQQKAVVLGRFSFSQMKRENFTPELMDVNKNVKIVNIPRPTFSGTNDE